MPENKPKDSITDQQAITFALIAVIAIAAVWISKNEARIYVWIFENFVPIGMAIFLSMAIFVRLRRRNQNSEMRRLSVLANIWNTGDGVYAGKAIDGCAIHVPDKTRNGHVQIIGATGRGKTESVILPWFVKDLHAGHSALLIDGKGDRGILRNIEKYVDHLPKKPKLLFLDLGNPAQSMHINPLKAGSAQQITDRLFQSLDFTDPYYKAVQFEIGGFLIELLKEIDQVVTFRRLYDLLSNDSDLAEGISQSRNEDLQRRLTAHLAESKKDRDVKTKGLVAQIAPFAKGELASLVNGGGIEFSVAGLVSATQSQLLELYGSENVAVVILLPTLLYQEMAVRLGRMIFQELAWAIADRKEANFTPVFLDEFSAFVYPGFGQILNKARSSGIALHLCHQSLGDLESVSAAFAQAINANTNVKCLLGLNDPVTADFYAKHLGTEGQEKVTERAKRGLFLNPRERTGDMSVREVEAYRIHPNDLKQLMNGEGVIHFSIPQGVVLERIHFQRLPAV